MNKWGVDRNKVEEEWGARGFSCGLWTDPPGREWKDYVHNNDELFMVVEGTVELELNGAVLRPGIGEEVLIPALSLHSVKNAGSITAKWLYGYKMSA
ncbi:MAG: cupin domain-containing protein [Candidatus Dadabacteria bacterium]|nr:cupin domain-containing protein [Candidatus Dadabacteria bacterium]